MPFKAIHMLISTTERESGGERGIHPRTAAIYQNLSAAPNH